MIKAKIEIALESGVIVLDCDPGSEWVGFHWGSNRNGPYFNTGIDTRRSVERAVRDPRVWTPESGKTELINLVAKHAEALREFAKEIAP